MSIGSRERKGKTEFEDALQQLFWEINVYPLMDNYVCLACGKASENPRPDKYPDGCGKCWVDFDKIGMYMMPDLLIGNAVILVNGHVHTKYMRKKKDEAQIKRLLELGYKVFVFENEDVDQLVNSKKFICHAALRYINKASVDSKNNIYNELLSKEREMTGIEHIRLGKTT